MTDKYELKDLQLHEENHGYFLTAIYRHENDQGIYECIIPKIGLPIRTEPIVKIPMIDPRCVGDRDFPTIDLGFGDCIIFRDTKGHLFTEKLIKEKVHDLTLSEIEKKLGY